jgi:hypothetical protein
MTTLGSRSRAAQADHVEVLLRDTRLGLAYLTVLALAAAGGVVWWLVRL